jgi:transposase
MSRSVGSWIQLRLRGAPSFNHLSWRIPILNYWTSRQINARVEGFNTKAKLVKRRAYGYISFENYRLRLLNAGGG